MKFGTKQLNNPTPTKVSNFIQVFTIICGALVAWIATASFIPSNVATVIQSVLGLLLTMAQGLKPFFGVATSQQAVPIDEVGEMEEKPKP